MLVKTRNWIMEEFQSTSKKNWGNNSIVSSRSTDTIISSQENSCRIGTSCPRSGPGWRRDGSFGYLHQLFITFQFVETEILSLAHVLPIARKPGTKPAQPQAFHCNWAGCLQAYRQALCRLPMYYFSHVVHFNLDPWADGHDIVVPLEGRDLIWQMSPHSLWWELLWSCLRFWPAIFPVFFKSPFWRQINISWLLYPRFADEVQPHGFSFPC